MTDRLIILVAFTALLALTVPFWRWTVRRRVAALRQAPLSEAVAALDLPDRPTVLYFTTPTCSQCRFQQTPILNRLGANWGDQVHVRKVDAIEQEALARHYGILTVPSTVVLDSGRQVVGINHGLASADRLSGQLSALLPHDLREPGSAHLPEVWAQP